jgi:hypothetical protein
MSEVPTIVTIGVVRVPGAGAHEAWTVIAVTIQGNRVVSIVPLEEGMPKDVAINSLKVQTIKKLVQPMLKG